MREVNKLQQFEAKQLKTLRQIMMKITQLIMSLRHVPIEYILLNPLKAGNRCA